MRNLTLTLLFFLGSLQLIAQVPEKPTDISPILVGEVLPNLTLFSAKNEAKTIAEIIDKPTVLVFYRGSWCPYCNVHLAELVKAEAEIIKLGYQIVAISPDDFQNLDETVKTNDMKYQLFSDKNGEFIKALGIAFKASQKTKDYVSSKTKGNVTEVLPVPTVLVVNAKAEVLFEYIKPDISKRIPSKLLIAALQNL